MSNLENIHKNLFKTGYINMLEQSTATLNLSLILHNTSALYIVQLSNLVSSTVVSLC